MKWILITLYLVVISVACASEASLMKSMMAKDELNTSDFLILKKRYADYQKTYHEQKLDRNSNIPIISTNAHHHVLEYWIKRYGQVTKGQRERYPILHFDSHTDMGFSPSHYAFKKKYSSTKKILEEYSLEKVKSFQKSLTDISQVIIPAMAVGLSDNVHMCLPPWFTRIDLRKHEGTRIPFSLKEFNKNQFYGAKVHRIYPVVDRDYDFIATPFYRVKKRKGRERGLYLYSCFDNPQLKIKSDYILSLDLDILSTNGKEHDHARPISSFRTIGDFISKDEFTHFKERLKKVINVIQSLKKKGHHPIIITISDSTEGGGGNYTPAPLAFLASVYIKFSLTD